MFFVQNAGAPDAGTGLNKSSIILKIDLAEAAAVSDKRNASGAVKVHKVDSNPPVINPNGTNDGSFTFHFELTVCTLGAANYKGEILFAAEGQGANVASELIISKEPYLRLIS